MFSDIASRNRHFSNTDLYACTMGALTLDEIFYRRSVGDILRHYRTNSPGLVGAQ
jgi:hypothetical protein